LRFAESANFPLGHGYDAMLSLASSLESSIIESLRGNIRNFCEKAAEISFVSSTAIKNYSGVEYRQDVQQGTR
jgi:hypothetical protein